MKIAEQIRLVGCGGVGSWVALALTRLAENVTLQDGDVLEMKNLDRQMFNEQDIGLNKAVALAQKAAMFGAEFRSDSSFLGAGSTHRDDIMIVAVDNNPARINAIEWADVKRRAIIIAANETTSSEAYYYDYTMAHTAHDPRVKYPSLITDRSGDPMSPCGIASQTNHQLAISNFMAASQAVWLLWFWVSHKKSLDPGLIAHFPKHTICTPTHFHVAR